MKISNNLWRYLERMNKQGEHCQNLTNDDIRCFHVAKALGLVSNEWVDSFRFKLSDKAKELLK
jgi:hypothetical protein